MNSIDEFAAEVFEEAKRFLEKYEEGNHIPAYLHAAVSLGFSSLEAHINAISEDFLTRPELNVLERGVLSEKDIEFDDGEFAMSKRLKMHRLEERLLFLCRRFSSKPIDRSTPLWSNFKSAIKLRNDLTHPKNPVEMTQEQVAKALTAILEILDHTYKALYKQGYPSMAIGLQSKHSF